jgi:hypothetical protein
LKQVQADESGEEQEVFADINGTGVDPQRQRKQDEAACDNSDYTFCVHAQSSLGTLNFTGIFGTTSHHAATDRLSASAGIE